MEPITRRGFDDPAKARAEDAAIKVAQGQTDQVLSDYAKRSDTFGGRYVCADTFKELMPGYANSPESRRELNNPVHNSAAVLASEQYRRLIAVGPSSEHDRVAFVTGIPGAGKSTSVAQQIGSNAAVVFEGQLSRPGPGIEKIEQALNAGFKVQIVAVHVPPEVALERTNFRYLDPSNGRGASISVMSDIQGNLPEGLRAIQDRFGDRVRVMVLDNTPGQQQQHFGWNAISTLQKEGTREHISTKLHNALEAGYASGRFSEGFYAQAAGRLPARQLGIGDGPSIGGKLQTDGKGPSVSQGDSKSNAVTPYTQGKQAQASPTPKPAAQDVPKPERGPSR